MMTSVGPADAVSLGTNIGWSDEGPIAGLVVWLVKVAARVCAALSSGGTIEASAEGAVIAPGLDVGTAGLRSIETSPPWDDRPWPPSWLDCLGRDSNVLISNGVEGTGVVFIVDDASS